MGDLISRSALIAAIIQHGKDVKCSEPILNELYQGAHKHIIDIVKIQPTAYSVEKVVAEIMILHYEGFCPNEDTLECVLDKSCSDCYRERINEIVRRGGVE